MPNLCEDLDVAWQRELAEPQRKEAVEALPRLYGDRDSPRLRYSAPAIPTPSEIVRNDVIFLSAGEMERAWAERVYVGLAQEQGDPVIQGFVHVRPKETLDALRAFEQDDPKRRIPRLIESYLTCPPRLRPSDAEGHIIEDNLAAYLYGDPYVVSEVTPYCRPHRLFAGVCAHAAAHMCLLLCSKRYGGHALGTFDIHRLASAGEGSFRKRVFGIRGLRGLDVAAVFSSPWAALDAIYDIRAVRDSFVGSLGVWQKQLYSHDAIRQGLLGFIDSECPVILAVDFDAWVRNADQPLRPDGELPQLTKGSSHGVVVVGYRREKTGRTSLILHDSAVRAFVTADLHAAFEAAEAYNPGRTQAGRERPARIHLVAAVPKSVRVAPLQAGLAAWSHTQRPTRSWTQKDLFLRTARYHLTPVCDLAAALGRILGRSEARLATAREVQALLQDEGVGYVWRVRPAHSPGAVFVDATRAVLPTELAARRDGPHEGGVLVTADPSRGVGVACPRGRGSDWWRFLGSPGS